MHFRLRTENNKKVTFAVHANRMKPFVDPASRPIDPPVNDVPTEPHLHETDIPKDSFEDGHETDVSVSSGAERSSLSQPQPEQVVVDNKSIFRAEKILKRRKPSIMLNG